MGWVVIMGTTMGLESHKHFKTRTICFFIWTGTFWFQMFFLVFSHHAHCWNRRIKPLIFLLNIHLFLFEDTWWTRQMKHFWTQQTLSKEMEHISEHTKPEQGQQNIPLFTTENSFEVALCGWLNVKLQEITNFWIHQRWSWEIQYLFEHTRHDQKR